MRDIKTVIDQINKEVPEEWPLLKVALERVLTFPQNFMFSPYTPPDIQRMALLGKVLDISLGSPDTPWKERIADIMAGRAEPTVEEINKKTMEL